MQVFVFAVLCCALAINFYGFFVLYQETDPGFLSFCWSVLLFFATLFQGIQIWW